MTTTTKPTHALRRARLSHGLSQDELAAEVGVSRHTVLNLERGITRPRPSTARRIAKAVDERIADVFPELLA
jgi:DNA-binding XRE family transcriptional regulator